MPHRNQLATPKVKDIERPLDITRPFMDDIEAFVRDRRGSRAGLRVITPERILVRSAKENLGEVLSVGEQWGSHDRLGPSDGDRVRPRVYGSLGGYALRFARRWMAG
jgi:hypothetical protein